MQLVLPIDGTTAFLADINQRLRSRFGQPGPWLRLDPVSQFGLTLISGRTYGAVSLEAFETLIARFGRWERVLEAPLEDVERVIHEVKFSVRKAEQLKAALSRIVETRAELNLDFLKCRTVDDALAWLERLPGVGRKVAAVTLNFSTLRMRALVIDTHHLRVLRRLRLVGPRVDIAKAYDRLMPWLPEDWMADDLGDHHQLMKQLGQEICRHSVPECWHCPLKERCPTARESLT